MAGGQGPDLTRPFLRTEDSGGQPAAPVPRRRIRAACRTGWNVAHAALTAAFLACRRQLRRATVATAPRRHHVRYICASVR